MERNKRKSMIKVRGGFSDKTGINPCNTQMQITEFDKRTRTFISNKLYDFLQITFNNECETRNIKYGPSDQNLSNIFCKNLMQNVFADSNHLPLGYHYDWERFYSRIEAVLMDAPYNEVLDLLGYICNWLILSTNKSLTHGEPPIIRNFPDANAEFNFIYTEIRKLQNSGILLKEICIVARTKNLANDYLSLLTKAGIRSYAIKRNQPDNRNFDGIRVATMHRVKGLEFKYVFIAALNHRVVPLAAAINHMDPISEKESITSEKCLLYVAMTRAQKGVYITSYGTCSQFLHQSD